MYRLSVLVYFSLLMMTSGKHPKDTQEQKPSTGLTSSSELVSSSTEPVISLKSEPPTTAEFVPSVKSDSRQGSLYLSSEDLSNIAPHDSDHHDHLDHEDLEHHESNHDDSDDHNLVDGDSSHDHEDPIPSAANATDLKGKIMDHVEVLSGGNSSETSANDTTTTSFEDITETTVDLAATDSAGCFTALRDQMEQRCFNKFQEVIFDVMGEPENKQEVCCALEDYEKCSLRGYQKTHCENDKQGLKKSLGAARLFMAAMNNVSCSVHRGRCSGSAPAVYTTGLLSMSMFMGIVLFLLL